MKYASSSLTAARTRQEVPRENTVRRGKPNMDRMPRESSVVQQPSPPRPPAM